MHINIIKPTPKPSIPVFVMSGEFEPSMTFVAGRCVCKACLSNDLTYFAYVEDAKCNECRQWQNEDEIVD
jgi:hypothetical protein